MHPLALSRYDQGVVDDNLPMNRLLLMLTRSPEKEAALQTFLPEVHSPGSAGFHRWLTPEQFGVRFGASTDDTQTVVSWLQSQGFQVARVSKGQSTVEFSGTPGTIRDALHTEIHKYRVGDKTFYANTREMAVPETIAASVSNFAPLNN